jgi:hypothetical protein
MKEPDVCVLFYSLLFHRQRIAAAGAAVSREKELAVLFSISFNVAGMMVYILSTGRRKEIALGDHGLLLARWICLLRARDIYVYVVVASRVYAFRYLLYVGLVLYRR